MGGCGRPESVGSQFRRQRQPTIAADNSGNWIAAWDSDAATGNSLDNSRNVYVARSSNAGLNWSNPAVLNTDSVTTTTHNHGVKLATDNAGNWVAVWEADRQVVSTWNYEADILVSRSTNNGATWSVPSLLHPSMAPDTASDVTPHISTNHSGTWITAWSAKLTSGSTTVDAMVSKSTDNGLNWSSPALLSSSGFPDPGFDSFPKAVSNGSNQWVVTWNTTNQLNGTLAVGGNIFFARSSDGGTTFSQQAVLNSDSLTVTNPGAPEVAYSSGKYTVAWPGVKSGNTQHDLRFSESADGQTWSAVSPVGTISPGTTQGTNLAMGATNDSIMLVYHQGSEDRMSNIMHSFNANGISSVVDWQLLE